MGFVPTSTPKELYTLTTRSNGAKWAKVKLYAVNSGRLELVCDYKFQPVGTSGDAALEAYVRATGIELPENTVVRELDTMRA